ncbi:hypothetical protein Tco_1434900 [Tanacetum coccineum]
MFAIIISWFLVCDVSEAFKDMIEHETCFIPNLMDEGLSALAMGTICGGGRCGRKGGMEDVWRVENVVGGSDDGGGSTCEVVVVFPNLFNDLITGLEGFRMGTKSTISPIEIVDWERLASDLLKCGKWWWICTSWWQVLKVVQVRVSGVSDKARVVVIVVGMWLFSWSVNDFMDEMSMMLVRATFLGGFLVEEEALEAIFGGELRRYYG